MYFVHVYFIGAGSGINSSANSLALNTYFKEKRRIATGLSWTITGLGPIIWPQVIAVILPLFEFEGTLLFFTGVAFNAVICAFVFQPVQWHVKQKTDAEPERKRSLTPALSIECDYCMMTKRRNQSIFSSQYLYNADNASATGYEIIDPGKSIHRIHQKLKRMLTCLFHLLLGIPMLSLANDGWSSRKSLFGSRSSLYSDRPSRFGSRKTSSQNLVNLNRSSSINLSVMAKERERHKITEIKIEEHPEDGSSGKTSQENVDVNKQKIQIPSDAPVDDGTNARSESKSPQPRRKISTNNTFNIEKEVLKNVSQKLEEFVSNGNRVPTFTNLENYCTCDEKIRLYLDPKLSDELNNEVHEEEKEELSIWRKIVIFFDLDLLRDFTYVNLMMGVTLGNFAELNFSVLTPFVLADWGFQKQQIATVMSLLGGVDISIRFFIPFIAGKIGWENTTFFLVGIIAMAMGRVCELIIVFLYNFIHII